MSAHLSTATPGETVVGGTVGRATGRGSLPLRGWGQAIMKCSFTFFHPGSKSNLLLDDGATDSRQHSPLLALR